MIRTLFDIVVILLIAVVFLLLLTAVTGPITICDHEYIPEPNDTNDEQILEDLDYLELNILTQQSMMEQSVNMAKERNK